MYPKKGTLAVGGDGDITIVDKRIEHDCFKRVSAIQRLIMPPYEGICITGKVRDVILRSPCEFSDGSLIQNHVLW